ncbi:OmpH family outer membrane protein [Candidatus Dependentiae bacterium]|nr:MAG: OmpH family outer membrane protein [Candidatus Dependentiae bacterium]
MNKKQSAILLLGGLCFNVYADQQVGNTKQAKSVESTNNSNTFKGKVKVVNGYEVAAESTQGKKIKQDFLQKKENIEKELQKKQAELATAHKEYTAKAPTLSEKARRDEEKKLAKLERDLKEQTQYAKEELESLMYLKTEELGKTFEQIVQQYGKEQDLDFVIDRSSGRPVYVAERLECTDDIIVLMNKTDEKNKNITTANIGTSASSARKTT